MQVGFSTLPHENTGSAIEAAITHKADLFVLVIGQKTLQKYEQFRLGGFSTWAWLLFDCFIYSAIQSTTKREAEGILIL